MAEEYDFLFKSIVVGDGGVGKTALTLRFSKGFFTEDYKMTIGVDFHVKTITIDTDEGPIRSKLQIWDTGGQERFSSIRPMYYRGSLGALLIFDLTNSASFVHLPQWIEEVRANVKNEIPLLLVGNKSDLVDQRVVSLDEINQFTSKFNLYYMETSAKTGEGVGDCFYILACLMIGSGVPDQLISRGIVFNPGRIPVATSGTTIPAATQMKSEFDYAAPPVPEPLMNEKQAKTYTFEPESEYDYAAPPVPEPVSMQRRDSISPFESEIEPKILIPEPQIEEPTEKTTEFEFKTPEEILSQGTSEEESASSFTTFAATPLPAKEEGYKPKAIPFSANVPVPAPAPEGFQTPQEKPSIKGTQEKVSPFLMTKEAPRTETESLMDYMPEPLYSKKDKKKIEKQKKKEEKEKRLQEERERQEKFVEEMKKTKKEKKEKPKKEKKEKIKHVETKKPIPVQIPPSPSEPVSTPTLFQALTQKADETIKTSDSQILPFTATKEAEVQESSKLRIIPNVADIESKPTAFTSFQSAPTVQKEERETTSKELLICKNCGSMLSSDYAFCNKCGNKL